jgi:hypothetical protein
MLHDGVQSRRPVIVRPELVILAMLETPGLPIRVAPVCETMQNLQSIA